MGRKIKYNCVVMCLVAASSAIVFGQKPPETPLAIPKPGHEKMPPRVAPPLPPHGHGETSEKYLKVDPSVNLSFCISRGEVKVNGWKRNEVRVYVEDGSRFNFNVREKSAKSGDPIWIGFEEVSDKGSYGGSNECIAGRDIEIDVPLGAALTLRGSVITTTIDSIRRSEVISIGGNISFRNVAAGIKASAGRGDITVESSAGSMSLESTTGNIVVFDAGEREIGDMFRAKTNGGTLSLQNVGHRQLDVSSVSGSVSFSGAILSGGSYNIRTTRGSIRLTIPFNSSSKISAAYGYGTFNSEIPIKEMAQAPSAASFAKSVVGTIGNGNALLKLTTSNGSINIRKQ